MSTKAEIVLNRQGFVTIGEPKSGMPVALVCEKRAIAFGKGGMLGIGGMWVRDFRSGAKIDLAKLPGVVTLGREGLTFEKIELLKVYLPYGETQRMSVSGADLILKAENFSLLGKRKPSVEFVGGSRSVVAEVQRTIRLEEISSIRDDILSTTKIQRAREFGRRGANAVRKIFSR